MSTWHRYGSFEEFEREELWAADVFPGAILELADGLSADLSDDDDDDDDDEDEDLDFD